MDGYDKQIEFLTKNPELIQDHWKNAEGLFQMACSDDFMGRQGCLTMDSAFSERDNRGTSSYIFRMAT